MKEQIKEKLDKRIEYILTKDVNEITPEEFMALTSKLSQIEFEESKEERNKEYVEMMTKLFTIYLRSLRRNKQRKAL